MKDRAYKYGWHPDDWVAYDPSTDVTDDIPQERDRRKREAEEAQIQRECADDLIGMHKSFEHEQRVAVSIPPIHRAMDALRRESVTESVAYLDEAVLAISSSFHVYPPTQGLESWSDTYPTDIISETAMQESRMLALKSADAVRRNRPKVALRFLEEALGRFEEAVAGYEDSFD